jgi:hypothetical protein
MAATTRTALKAFLESLGLGITAYQDEAPEGHAYPYIVILGPIGFTPDKLESGGTLLTTAQANATRPTGQPQTVTELLQVDLWQSWRNPDHTLAESYTLAETIVSAVHGARLPSAPKIVYSCIVRGMLRLFERDSNLVHNVLTVAVHRQMT